MECKQSHYFFVILGEDSLGILTVIPCERMIIGNCITANVKPDHYMILLCCQSLQEHFEAASSCTKLLLVIKPMRKQFKFTHRLICTPEYILHACIFAHANWTIVFLVQPSGAPVSFCSQSLSINLYPEEWANQF